ncbi:DUF4129 domain-containing transglutaminase family protein [Paenibacillus crassostreae]|uniref:Transglutaminase-like domain-containing protein n=1 Tax=Paenibacillus crassostreae TaxID=1763538 RepID=A0A167C123_9BACL|nr:transglutaminase domain-containing protein [Paenibacillus crassostreae]AOZ91775.1 hypothetical protein LPB68_05755 [Paenibacillus crassostreae]OAB72652.1 hypothetical protein PNBC_14495 [Paenibacillus crassostreae]
MTKLKHLWRYDWLASFTFLWIWIVVKQWLSFTEPVWFEETTLLVERTVIIIAIIEILLPLKRVYRILIECTLILLLLYRTLIEFAVFSPVGELNHRIEQFITVSYPYIWFVLITAVLCLFIAKFIVSKLWIIIFMGLNMIALAILDSFTSIILWDEAAWMAFAMLGWLVSHHFQKFKQKYPQGWKHLLHYPFEMAAHIVLVFSVIFLLGINMPSISPIITDPYTVWREWKASPGGPAQQAFLEEVNAQPSISGYSREDNQLGGAFEFDYSLVMTVNSPSRNYWRGETRRLYSGTGWENESSDDSYSNVQVGKSLESDLEPIVQTEEVQQTMTLLSDTVYPVLFGAYQISSIETINGEQAMKGLQWNSAQSALFWNEQMNDSTYPSTYSITSKVPIIPVEELSQQSYDELYNESIEEEYLQIPTGFPERVTELAISVTQSAETPYDKMALLQAYLQTNYEYTNTPDVTRKISNDFVDSFLFEIREGYCDYFSTSIVMMARSLDIPARWVKGYAPGSQPEMEDFRMMQQGNMNTGVYTVSNADAHSWAEVYFGPYGWIPIEATPGFNMPLLTELDSEELNEMNQQEDQELSNDEKIRSTESKITTAWIKGISITAVTLLLLWLGYVVWRSRHSMYFLWLRLRHGKELTSGEKVVVETERWIAYLHKRGMKRQMHETLRESVMKWQQYEPALGPLLQNLLQLFEKAKYSPESVAAGEWREVQRIGKQLNLELTTKRKI